MVQHPEALIILVVLVPLIYTQLREYRLAERDLRRIYGPRRRDVHNVLLVKWFFSSLFLVIFVVFAVLASAGITWGRRSVEEDRRGLDVVVAVDVSRSMLAADVRPSRIERSKELLRSMVQDLPDARFAVVVFKGSAFALVPMTEDRAAIESFIRSVGPGLTSAGGTDVEAGLRQALESFPDGSGRNRAIVLITDGETLSGSPLVVAEDARDEGIPIFTVVAGTADGTTVTLASGDLLTDRRGEPVITAARPDLLREVSRETKGGSYSMTEADVFSGLIRGLSEYRARRESEGFRLVAVERYQGFLLVALAFLALHIAVRVVRWREVL
ncbi:MAG: vWA domain-containing protein [Spirochaetota bacterium]